MAIPERKPYTEEDYENIPEEIHAELVNGQIYYQAAPGRIHQKILMALAKTIANYIDTKKGDCEVYPAPFAVSLSDGGKHIVEPDISVICDPGKLTDRGCEGAPDWIIEIISPGNSSHDYVTKLNLYQAAGVREYWIVNPINRSIFVYYLEETMFKALSYTFNDKIKVNIYGDLEIDFQGLNL